ncbi:MAG: pilus assembly protein PilP [Rhodoferax sp.]
MKRNQTPVLCMLTVVVVVLLSACGYTTEQEVRSFVDAERAALHPVSKVIPAPKPFEAAVYDDAGRPDPFSRQAFMQALLGAAKVAKPSIATPELARNRTELEGYPLDALAMVGLLTKEGQNLALVRAGGRLYQVSVGSYLGQNLGKVTKIEETRLTLRELVQDDLGEWSTRTNMLTMQERTK